MEQVRTSSLGKSENVRKQCISNQVLRTSYVHSKQKVKCTKTVKTMLTDWKKTNCEIYQADWTELSKLSEAEVIR